MPVLVRAGLHSCCSPSRMPPIGFLCGMLFVLSSSEPEHLNAQDSTSSDPTLQKIPMSAAIQRAHGAGTRDSTGRPGPAYWQLWTDYTIEARLDEDAGKVFGSERVVLKNSSPVPLDFVQIRLDQNRFRSSTPQNRNVHSPTDGSLVTRVVVNGENATLGPADSNTAPALSGTHGTSERLTLAEPVLPGERLTLEFKWSFEIPHGRSLRLGRFDNYLYQVAQWYPRVAMFDDLNGWDLSTFDGNVEFYNPYGRFDVKLDVPGGWLVGATGVLQNPEEVLAHRTRARLAQALQSDSTTTIVGQDEGGAGQATTPGDRLVWHFVADTVRDFAWGTSERYFWKATRAVLPGRGPIPVHILNTSDDAAMYEDAAAVVRYDLAFNSELILPYAYPQHTLLGGPEGAMEYPMLTMSNGSLLGHELWHQWWPMMVGSNETWYSFLDEGFSIFLSGVTSPARSGMPPRYAESERRDKQYPLIWPDDRGPPDVFASVYGYGTPPRMFSALGVLVGRDAVLRALREYAEAWRFKHPSPWDFMFFMNEALERDFSEFWCKWLFSRE